jgi:hypothetical protein
MASGKYEYLSQKMLNFIFNGGSWSAPGTLYLALYTVAPSISSGGTEATGSGYARLSITSNTTNWPSISGSTTTMSNGVAFTMATATGNWSSSSNMTDAGLLDASTSGNLYYWGDLTVAKPILSGDTPSMSIGALTVQEL